MTTDVTWDDRATAFSRELADALGVAVPDQTVLGPTTDLYADWALDSLQAFQLIIVVEAMAGADVPPPEVPALFTLGDAYDYYRSLRSADGGGDPP